MFILFCHDSTEKLSNSLLEVGMYETEMKMSHEFIRITEF